MPTFKEAYCEKFSCRPEDFGRRAFMKTLYPQALPLALLGGYRSSRFARDRVLIDYCGSLRSFKEVEAEIKEYTQLGENRRFLRRTLRLRVSGRRLARLAAECFGM